MRIGRSGTSGGVKAISWCRRPCSTYALARGVGLVATGRGGSPLPWGFNCSAGWDPVTGLGVPVFPKLMAAAMKAGERRA